MTPIRTIAFVGLGNMGVPIAAQLAANRCRSWRPRSDELGGRRAQC